MTHVPETFFRGFHARPSLNRLARLFSLFVAAMITVLIPGISNAIIWNDVTDFSSSNPSGAWRYGQGITGTSFTAYTNFRTNCDGFSGVSCWQPLVPVDGVPLVGKNTGSTFGSAGILFPTDVLWVHPYLTGSDSIVQWTAPAAGLYNISGFFEVLDATPTGVLVNLYDNSAPVFAGVALNGPATPPNTPNTPGQKYSFSNTLPLAAGDVISFGVNNGGGNYYYDSTGLAATITRVPEPTSLSLLAIGLAGFWSLRKRRSKVVVRNR